MVVLRLIAMLRIARVTTEFSFMKREGIITLFIFSYLRALSFLLDHLLLFECVLVVVIFESILKMELRNGSRFYKNAYKVFVSKIVQKCVCEMCF